MYDMEESNDDLQIEAPLNLLADLDSMGIVEIDKGICENTAENRRLLFENKCRWVEVFTTSGRATNLIQVITPEARAANALISKEAVLRDPKDVDSDYLTGFDLLIEIKADDVVPAWVLAATREWNRVEEEREKRVKDSNPKPYRPYLAGPPARCRAARIDGHRCLHWSNGLAEYDGLCRVHFSTLKHTEEFGPGIVQRAKNRIMTASLQAAEIMEELAHSATSEQVRQAAARDLMDRAGLRGVVEVEANITVTGKPAAEVVKERLTKMALAAAPTTPEDTEGEVIEAELVEIEVKTDDEQ